MGRLALRVKPVLLSMTALACEEVLKTREPDGKVARFTISPRVVSLSPDQQIEFTAVGLTVSGDTAEITVAWSATNGRIIDMGLRGGRHYSHYQSGSCDEFKVVA